MKFKNPFARFALGPVVGLACITALANPDHAAATEDPSPAGRALSEVELFRRCFGHLTGKTPMRSLSLMQKVRSGSLGGLAACQGILSGVRLNSSNGLVEYVDTASLGLTTDEGAAIALDVLRHFNDLHRTWFPSDSLYSGLPDGSRHFQTRAIHEEGAPALFVTRALLLPSETYDSVVTLSDNLEAIRDNGAGSLAGFGQSNSAGTVVPLQSGTSNLGVQTGALLGIRKIGESSDKAAATKTLSRITSADPDFGVTWSATTRSTIALHQHLGGGLLGSESYLLLNMGLGLSESGNYAFNPVDGGLYVSRRHARAALMDLLCRDIPPLRPTDAAIWVQSTPATDTPGFRASASCMACHASLDAFAGTTRQAHYASTSEGTSGATTLLSSVHVAITATTLSREAGTVDSDSDFGKRPPYGRLLFRSYDGTLINQSVANLSEMGTAMAATEDLYVCAANRYFQSLTGIKANLQDAGDPQSEELDDAETRYRETVVTLGKSFKSHRSLKRLLQEIMALPLYQSRGQREAFASSSAEGAAE